MTILPDLISSPTALILWAIFGYLLGSIPFGIVIARAMGLGDLRQIGSGNIGATNVLRTGSKLAALLTLVLDAGKAGIAVLIARACAADDATQLAGFMAFFGHCYPIWLKFKGGKGVATFFGLLFAVCWTVGLAAGAAWLIIAAVSRYSSLAAIVTVILTPIWTALLGVPNMIALTIALALLVIWRHRENISRLRTGQESKIGRK
ncbi:MAG: glycerol-3-phosphate 1-O-acyltransferase PlsY [Planktomarina sp.]